MAQAYAAVLGAQGVDFYVIGRSSASAQTFQQATGRSVFSGGLEMSLASLPIPQAAIVAVGVEHLASTARDLLNAGCRSLLLEKPGALYLSDLEDLYATANSHEAEVWIAYNRRFYSSVQKLRQSVVADGGVTSALFEFTEWNHLLKDLPKPPAVKERWMLVNSTHVIDLAFNFIGLPAEDHWKGWHHGALDWHPSAARFHGAGISEHGIPFAYKANWEAPGRWGLELLTRQNRFLLSPIESLQFIPLGSHKAQPVNLDDTLDRKFKPGLFEQCKAFLESKTEDLCSLKDHFKAFPVYCRMAGYHF
jgi:hypothetical protein